METGDCIAEAAPLDQSHRVKGATLDVVPETVDRHHARMLQVARDFGFQHETSAAVRVVRELRSNFLERNLAVQFSVESDGNPANASLGMRPQYTESPTGVRVSAARRQI